MLKPGRLPALPPPTETSIRSRAGLFLTGGISWSWLVRAAQLPGAGLAVALALCMEASLVRASRFRVPSKWRGQLGVSRHAEARAFRELERAKLIALRRRRGARPHVELIDWSIRPRGAVGDELTRRRVRAGGEV